MKTSSPSPSSPVDHKRKTERKKFTELEDKKLEMLVQVFGDMNWPVIAKAMEGRTTRQCRERYKTYLAPNIRNEPWKPEEDELLISLVKQIGPKWAEIAKRFNGRTDNNVKNRWYTYLKDRNVKVPQKQKKLSVPVKHQTESSPELVTEIFSSPQVIHIPETPVFTAVTETQCDNDEIKEFEGIFDISFNEPHFEWTVF